MAEPENFAEWDLIGQGLYRKTQVYPSRYEKNDYSQKIFTITWIWCDACRRYTKVPPDEIVMTCPKCADGHCEYDEESWEEDSLPL